MDLYTRRVNAHNYGDQIIRTRPIRCQHTPSWKGKCLHSSLSRPTCTRNADSWKSVEKFTRNRGSWESERRYRHNMTNTREPRCSVAKLTKRFWKYLQNHGNGRSHESKFVLKKEIVTINAVFIALFEPPPLPPRYHRIFISFNYGTYIWDCNKTKSQPDHSTRV